MVPLPVQEFAKLDGAEERDAAFGTYPHYSKDLHPHSPSGMEPYTSPHHQRTKNNKHGRSWEGSLLIIDVKLRKS